MQQRLGLAIAALVAAAFAHFSIAVMAQGGRPEVKQIQLTEKQVQGVIAAQKDVSAILEKIQGPPPGFESERLTPQHKEAGFEREDRCVG